jgi:hypothetical protein
MERHRGANVSQSIIKSLTCGVTVGQAAGPPRRAVRAQLDINSEQIFREAPPSITEEPHVVSGAAAEARRPGTYLAATGPAVTIYLCYSSTSATS